MLFTLHPVLLLPLVTPISNNYLTNHCVVLQSYVIKRLAKGSKLKLKQYAYISMFFFVTFNKIKHYLGHQQHHHQQL
jgi:hypothetical protein